MPQQPFLRPFPLLARLSLFVIFFWFGILKVIGTSPALPLVQELHGALIPFVPFSAFFVLFGFFEMGIGALFLIPKAEKGAFTILLIHMFMTFLPLLLLPGAVWRHALTPTLEGQYIIKNIALIALAFGLVKE